MGGDAPAGHPAGAPAAWGHRVKLGDSERTEEALEVSALGLGDQERDVSHPIAGEEAPRSAGTAPRDRGIGEELPPLLAPRLIAPACVASAVRGTKFCAITWGGGNAWGAAAGGGRASTLGLRP